MFLTFRSKNFRFRGKNVGLKMAEFINFEAESEFVDINSSEDDETSNGTLSEISFVDNNETNKSINFYRQFTNVENDLN